jgi:hypothetical protein
MGSTGRWGVTAGPSGGIGVNVFRGSKGFTSEGGEPFDTFTSIRRW